MSLSLQQIAISQYIRIENPLHKQSEKQPNWSIRIWYGTWSLTDVTKRGHQSTKRKKISLPSYNIEAAQPKNFHS